MLDQVFMFIGIIFVILFLAIFFGGKMSKNWGVTMTNTKTGEVKKYGPLKDDK